MSLGASNILYVLSDAVRSVRSNLATAVLTAATLGFSLAIFALFAIVFLNLNGLAKELGDRTLIVAYIKDSALAADGIEKLKAEAMKMPGAASAEFISKEKALLELKKGLEGHESVLEGVDANPLPSSFEIRLKDSFRDPAEVSQTVARLKAMGWVEDVQYNQDWVEKFSAFLKFLEAGAFVIGVFLAAATLFIISNTVRLTVYARKDEIEIMRLVGASDMFVKVPFFLEGVFQGLAGGALAFVILSAAKMSLASKIPPYMDFALQTPVAWPALLAVLVACGVVMGAAGTLISMGRFLKV